MEYKIIKHSAQQCIKILAETVIDSRVVARFNFHVY